MLVQIVVTVIPFDHGMVRGTKVASHRGQLTPELAAGYITVAIAQQQIRAVAEELSLTYASPDVDMRGRDGTAFVIQFDFTERFLGGALGHKVEHARRVGGTI